MRLLMTFPIFVLIFILVSCDSGEHEEKLSVTPFTKAVTPTSTESTSGTPADAIVSTIDTTSASVPAKISTTGELPPSDIVDTPLWQANSETFQANEIAYVTAPYASVNMNGTIISLPIGTSIKVKGPAKTCSFESVSQEETICIWGVFGDETEEGYPDGLASANRFSHTHPDLNTLLAEYDKTPTDNRDLRKALAEKAISLDPWSNEAYKRLRNVLNEIGDPALIEAAEITFQRYQEHQPMITQGEYPTLFHYDGQKITPFVAIKDGAIKQANMYPAMAHRGTFVYVYDANNKVGFAVTTRSYLVRNGTSISGNPVKNIRPDGKPTVTKLGGIYATNFPWPERNKPPSLTNMQRSMLKNMLSERLAKYSEAAASTAQAAIQSENILLMSGQLSADGRIFLVGGLVVGSASDVHYSDMPYVSEFVILEQQKDGSFVNAITNLPRFREEYCSISDILRDMNGDGTDEIITYCNSGVEGPYEDYLNGILQRINNQWVKAF